MTSATAAEAAQEEVRANEQPASSLSAVYDNRSAKTTWLFATVLVGSTLLAGLRLRSARRDARAWRHQAQCLQTIAMRLTEGGPGHGTAGGTARWVMGYGVEQTLKKEVASATTPHGVTSASAHDLTNQPHFPPVSSSPQPVYEPAASLHSESRVKGGEKLNGVRHSLQDHCTLVDTEKEYLTAAWAASEADSAAAMLQGGIDTIPIDDAVQEKRKHLKALHEHVRMMQGRIGDVGLKLHERACELASVTAQLEEQRVKKAEEKAKTQAEHNNDNEKDVPVRYFLGRRRLKNVNDATQAISAPQSGKFPVALKMEKAKDVEVTEDEKDLEMDDDTEHFVLWDAMEEAYFDAGTDKLNSMTEVGRQHGLSWAEAREEAIEVINGPVGDSLQRMEKWAWQEATELWPERAGKRSFSARYVLELVESSNPLQAAQLLEEAERYQWCCLLPLSEQSTHKAAEVLDFNKWVGETREDLVLGKVATATARLRARIAHEEGEQSAADLAAEEMLIGTYEDAANVLQKYISAKDCAKTSEWARKMICALEGGDRLRAHQLLHRQLEQEDEQRFLAAIAEDAAKKSGAV